jgi:hypothetical protein
VRHGSAAEPIERALQDEYGGVLIDDLGAARGAPAVRECPAD